MAQNTQQIIPDEIPVDYSKLDLIKNEQDLIFKLFHVNLTFGKVTKKAIQIISKFN